MATKHGVNVEQLNEAVETMSEDPDAGEFRFYAETEWRDALKCVTEIDEFDRAGEQIRTQEFHVEATSPLVDNITNEVPLETDLVVE